MKKADVFIEYAGKISVKKADVLQDILKDVVSDVISGIISDIISGV